MVAECAGADPRHHDATNIAKPEVRECRELTERAVGGGQRVGRADEKGLDEFASAFRGVAETDDLRRRAADVNSDGSLHEVPPKHLICNGKIYIPSIALPA